MSTVTTQMTEIKTPHNTHLAKVAVQCSADTFTYGATSWCGENRHIAKPQTVSVH